MEKVFESYIAKCAKRQLSNVYTVRTQASGKYLFDKPKCFSLRPDIMLDKGDKHCCIIDTKWKLLDKNKQNNGISQADMYQMYAYAKKYDCKNIILLYPKSTDFPNVSYIAEGITVDIQCVEDLNDV